METGQHFIPESPCFPMAETSATCLVKPPRVGPRLLTACCHPVYHPDLDALSWVYRGLSQPGRGAKSTCPCVNNLLRMVDTSGFVVA